MSRILFHCCLAIIVACTASALAPASANAQDPGIPDTIRVDSVTANATDHFALPIWFYCDDTLVGATIGLNWGTEDLTLDSISFVGSALSGNPNRIILTNEAFSMEALVGFNAFPGGELAPTAGL